jgi:antitoxin (DNA-binding transcriptional repressor) of toxin-antitoxin stability system
VERGETIRITRDGHPIAELRPITPATGRALRAALADAAITAAEQFRTLVSLDARARYGDLAGVTSLGPLSDHAV